MKNNLEEKLSSIIDVLNQNSSKSSMVGTSQKDADGQEIEDLRDIAVAIKRLPNLELPGEEFVERGAARIRAAGRYRKGGGEWFKTMGVIAAGLLLTLLLLSPWSSLGHKDIVLAAVETIQGLQDYHGTLEMRTVAENQETWLVRRAEIWNQGEKYAIKAEDGSLTVNNGEKKWQVVPKEKLVNILPLLPDPLQGRFDLRAEASQADNYPHKVLGEEMVAGRNASKVEITPPGGLPYYLWIDMETKLPIQLQTAVANSLQTVYTLVNLQINMGVPKVIFSYQPDPEYRVVEKNPVKIVSTLEEAAAIAGFSPTVPKDSPKRILAAGSEIVFDYGDTVVTQAKTDKPFVPAPNGSIGKADNAILEVIGDTLRWQQNGLEISIEGPTRVELAKQIVKVLELPQKEQDFSSKAKVEVPVDLEVVKNSQQQVDGGHSPWMIDPAQVGMAFINEKFGEKSQVAFEDIKVETNSGSQAVLNIKVGPIKKLYLQRILRQDESGIWTVVGYDPS